MATPKGNLTQMQIVKIGSPFCTAHHFTQPPKSYASQCFAIDQTPQRFPFPWRHLHVHPHVNDVKDLNIHSPMQKNLFIDLPMPFLVKSVELHPKR